MKLKQPLPIGSVVRLKKAQNALMIIGIMVKDDNGNENDYISVMYPEGYISRDIFFKFNHSDIEEILFEGFQSKDREQFLKLISDSLK